MRVGSGRELGGEPANADALLARAKCNRSLLAPGKCAKRAREQEREQDRRKERERKREPVECTISFSILRDRCSKFGRVQMIKSAQYGSVGTRELHS